MSEALDVNNVTLFVLWFSYAHYSPEFTDFAGSYCIAVQTLNRHMALGSTLKTNLSCRIDLRERVIDCYVHMSLGRISHL